METKKVGSEKNSGSPLYCETNESENFLNMKNVKMNKITIYDLFRF